MAIIMIHHMKNITSAWPGDHVCGMTLLMSMPAPDQMYSQPQDVFERIPFKFPGQGKLQLVGRAIVGMPEHADLAVSTIQVQLDCAGGPGRRIDDLSGLEFDAMRNLNLYLVI